jgi:SAM-dependent methyltransferase
MPSARGQAAGPSLSVRAIAYHEALAAGWSQRYARGGFKRRAAFFVDAVLPRIACRGDWIDVGCGSGHFSRILAGQGASVLGIDGSAAMIGAARAHPATPAPRYALETVESLAGRAPRFDGALCLSVLEYLDDPAAGFTAMAAMLKPGGFLVVSAPNRRSPLRALQQRLRRLAGALGVQAFDYLDSSKQSWSREGLAALASGRGLSCEAILGFDPVAPRLAWGVAPSLWFLICRKPEDGAQA